MYDDEIEEIKNHLIERRGKLNKAIRGRNSVPQLVELLHKVDSALERMDTGTYGKCEACCESIEKDRLIADPLTTFCLEHLNGEQKKWLEQDLELASQIQNTLLPPNNLVVNGYEVNYHYIPAGPVSGDYCDFFSSKDGNEILYFILGDITGKGIAASMLVNHVYAIFHSLTELNLSLEELMKRANRQFCESSLYSHFATLVCGKASKDGVVEISNAGHCLPVFITKDGVKNIDSTGLPLGLFHSAEYKTIKLNFEPGDSLLIYSDGLSEARREEEEFGVDRINKLAELSVHLSAFELIELLLKNLNSFTRDSKGHDDLTLMAIKRKV